MNKKNKLIKTISKYLLISILAPIILYLLNSFFDRYLLKAEYNKEKSIYYSEIQVNKDRYNALQEGVNMLIKFHLNEPKTPCVYKK